MRADSTARRYAQAIFELAGENGDYETWARELEAIASTMSDPAVSSVLRSVRVRSQDKQALLEQLLTGLRPMALNVGRVLVNNDRVDRAASIRDAYQGMLDELQGIVHAHVTSAVPLGDQEQSDLIGQLSKMTGGKVELHPSVDPSILGGLIVRIGDRLIDGSVRARLTALRRQLRGVPS